MTSYETAEDRMGKTKVTAAFFKKLGEKLRNYQRYQKPVQLSESPSISSCSLDLSSNVKSSDESIRSENFESAEKDYAKQIADKKIKYRGTKQQIQNDKRKEKNEMKEKLEETRKEKNQTKQEGKELIEKKKSKSKNFENVSAEREDNSESLNKSYQSIGTTSVTDSGKRSESEEESFTETTSSVRSKLVDQFHESIKTNFDLGDNNILSILKFKNDPNAIIYDLQNPNGCRIYLEKMANRAILLSVDDTGRRLYISCTF
ncbi:hypothetical protein ACH3XW_20035 [Acanthocheilonema viteae]